MNRHTNRFREPVSLILAIKHADLSIHFAQERVRIAIETETNEELANTATRGTAGGDSRKLRGIPAIGRSVAGAISETTPGSPAHLEALSA